MTCVGGIDKSAIRGLPPLVNSIDADNPANACMRLRKSREPRDACLYVLTAANGASSLLSWVEGRKAAGHPLTTLRLQGEVYDIERSGLESVAERGTWDEIRALVHVVDEWKIETGVRTRWVMG